MTIFNYTVNYVDIIIAALFLLTAIFGWRRGIALGVTNFIRYSSGMFLCFYMSNNFYQFVYDNYAKQKCLDIINEKIVVSNNIDETIKNLNDFGNSLPDFVSRYIDFKSINISSTDIAQSILTNIFEPFVLGLIKVLIFVAVFIIFFGITGIILMIIRSHMRKKEKIEGRTKLRTADKFFGMLFGMLKALIIVCALASAVKYVGDLDMDFVANSEFLKQATSSGLLKFVENFSPFNAIMEGII